MSSVEQSLPLLRQPETLKRTLLLEYGKRLIAKKHYEIETLCGDLPPTLIRDLYNIIIEEFDQCLYDIEDGDVKVFGNRLYVKLYLSPAFPNWLNSFIRKCITESRPVEKTTEANRQWIKFEDAVQFHFTLYKMRHCFQVSRSIMDSKEHPMLH